jgi:nitrate/nitrite transporter NarK
LRAKHRSNSKLIVVHENWDNINNTIHVDFELLRFVGIKRTMAMRPLSSNGLSSYFARPRTLRWALPVLVGLVIFGNHYTRDTFGALEKQLEATMDLSSREYALSNALYFFPNMITPLIAGMAAKRVGASKLFLWSSIVAALGHILVALAVQFQRKWLLLAGRALGGTFYEVIDCLPISFVAPFFTAEWASVTGALNGFLRLGSIANFMLCPVAFAAAGLEGAFWLACAVGASGVLFAAAIRRVEAHLDPEDFAIRNETKQRIGAEVEGDLEMMSAVSLKLVASDVRLDGAETGARGGNSSPSAEDSDDDDDGWVARPKKQKQLISTSRSTNRSDGGGGSRSSSEGIAESDLALLNKRSGKGVPTASRDVSSSDFNASSTKTTPETMSDRWIPNFTKYSRCYYLYLASGAMLYGAMVPFWFIGSKYMQDYYDMSVGRADTLMLLPEGLIVFISSPLGYYIDRSRMGLSPQLRLLAMSCLALAVGYVMLLFGAPYNSTASVATAAPIPPLLSMLVLGGSYGVSNSVFWACITQVINDNEELGPATGLVACAMNIFPSLLPLGVAAAAAALHLRDYDPNRGGQTGDSFGSLLSDRVLSSESAFYLVVLSACAVLAAAFAFASSARAFDRPADATSSISSTSTTTTADHVMTPGDDNPDSSSHGLLAAHSTSSSSPSPSPGATSTNSTAALSDASAYVIPKVQRGRFSPGSNKPTLAHTSELPAALRYGRQDASTYEDRQSHLTTIDLASSPNPLNPTTTAPMASHLTRSAVTTPAGATNPTASVPHRQHSLNAEPVAVSTASWLRDRVLAAGQLAVHQAREGIAASGLGESVASALGSIAGSSSSSSSDASSSGGGQSAYSSRSEYFRDAY